jgi:signal transduction histidine kinase
MSDQPAPRPTHPFVSIRAKVVLALLLATVPIVVILGYFGLESSTNLLRAQAVDYMRVLAMMHARRLEEGITRGMADARYLSSSDWVAQFAQACARPDGSSAEQTARIARDFGDLADAARIYSEVRYIDASGRERARVIFQPDHVEVAPDRRLRDRSNRAYFRAAMHIEAGEVYVSSLNLDRESGRVERPLRPVMHFASPVVVDGKAVGIVVLNLATDTVLPAVPGQEASVFLADEDGWYLAHTNPAKAWSGPENLGTGGSLWQDMGEKAASALQPVPTVITAKGDLYATRPIVVDAEPQPFYLIMGVETPDAIVFKDLRDFRRYFWGLLVVGFVVPVVAGLVLSSYFLRPVYKLHTAVHEVAGGNLDATVEVTSDDEFHELANDFNAMAARLREYREEERLAVVGRMAAALIHDIRNPLGSVSAFARLLATSGLSDEERRATADKAVAQVQRIVGMLQELLEFSRGEGGRLEAKPVQVDRLLADLEPELRARCKEQGTELVLSSEGSGHLEADPEKLRRAILNITANSLEAMGHGGKLSIRSKCDGQGAEIVVTDTGPGIPAEILDSVFEPFVSRGKSEGTGLGLAITKAIVEAHGGRLEAANPPGGGAAFTIWLPTAGRG